MQFLKTNQCILHSYLRIFGLIVLLALTQSCSSFEISKPEGFAAYQKQRSQFRAISPKGVRFMVKEIRNDPKGNLATWTDIIESHLMNLGYHGIQKQEIKTKQGTKGSLIVSHYNLHNRQYTYLLALFVKEDKIILIQTAGEAKEHQNHSLNIIEAIKTLQW